MPKVLINPQFSFGEMSKTALDMKEHLDDICKKELSKISKTGWWGADDAVASRVGWKPPSLQSSVVVPLHS